MPDAAPDDAAPASAWSGMRRPVVVAIVLLVVLVVGVLAGRLAVAWFVLPAG